MIIAEIPSGIWNFNYGDLPITREGITVNEYLCQNEVTIIQGDVSNAEFRIYKDENVRNGLLSIRRFKGECQKRFSNVPYMNLNGEAQEWSRASYLLADKTKTFSVAPGTEFKRLFFPTLWTDPSLDEWDTRQDKICWIGRPLPERIALAKIMHDNGIPFDVYSRDSWGIPEWKGYAENTKTISRNYKYQIVYENSLKNLYHSEKLINSIMAGCVTFYQCDPALTLPHLSGAYLPLSIKYMLNRELLSKEILYGIKKVVFGKRWETHSLKHFFDVIIEEAYNS